MKLVVDNTVDDEIGFALHGARSDLDHLKKLESLYPEQMAANLNLFSEIFRDWTEFYARMARKCTPPKT